MLTRRQFGLSVAGGVAFALSRRVSTLQLAVWATGRIAVPGGNVFWRTYGEGTRLPLLAVHGGPSGADSKPIELLSPLGDERRLASWDQLDSGQSDRPNDPANWRLARFVDEMDVVRNTLTPGPVHVLGGSWGSTLAMEWLVTKRPTNLASVIFMCPTLDIARAEASRRAAQMRLSPASRQAFEDAGRTGDFRSPAIAAANEEYQRTFIIRRPRSGLAIGPPAPAMLRVLGADLRNWSRVPQLAKLTQPVLFIRGQYDHITAEDVGIYAAAAPNSQVATIPDAAHLAFVDNPRRTNEVLRRFLNRVER
jgi:pimeloyl-ACP methyl ester carboxylesterase